MLLSAKSLVSVDGVAVWFGASVRSQPPQTSAIAAPQSDLSSTQKKRFTFIFLRQTIFFSSMLAELGHSEMNGTTSE